MFLRRVEPTQTFALDLRQGEVDQDAVTRLYGSLWALLHRGPWQAWRRGYAQLSFEVHATHERIRFYVTVPASQGASVRRQLQLTFPGLSVGDVIDPLANWAPSQAAEVAGTLLIPRREPVYPLQWEYSPTAYLRGAMALQDGEEVWIQVVARPRFKGTGSGAKRAAAVVGMPDIVAGTVAVLEQAGVQVRRPASPKGKAAPASGQIDYMSLDRKHQLAAATKTHAGHLWQTVIRVLAVAPGGRAYHLRKAAVAPFCWDGGPNSLRPWRAWFPRRLLQRMQRRWLPVWWTKCLLSPAELGALAQVVPPPIEAQSGARVLVVEEDLT